jgi:hypothetical protein
VKLLLVPGHLQLRQYLLPLPPLLPLPTTLLAQ